MAAIVALSWNVIQASLLPNFSFGNRCGHNPQTMRQYQRPIHHKYRPSVLEKAIDTISSYYKNSTLLKSIASLMKPTKIGDHRQKRSEAREAIIAVGQVLLHFCELGTLQVGIKLRERFVSLSLDSIAKHAGLSVIRTKRALRTLEKARYLTTVRRYIEKTKGIFRSITSIRSITLAFLQHLGISDLRLNKVRLWKAKRDRKFHIEPSLTLNNKHQPAKFLKRAIIFERGTTTQINALRKIKDLINLNLKPPS